MTGARTHAHPTEFMPAFLASHVTDITVSTMSYPDKRHVLATPILLYGTLALTTLLCVTLDPVGGFTIISTLLQPHLGDGTNNWAVVTVDIAPKAELMVGAATYGWHHSCEGGT